MRWIKGLREKCRKRAVSWLSWLVAALVRFPPPTKSDKTEVSTTNPIWQVSTNSIWLKSGFHELNLTKLSQEPDYGSALTDFYETAPWSFRLCMDWDQLTNTLVLTSKWSNGLLYHNTNTTSFALKTKQKVFSSCCFFLLCYSVSHKIVSQHCDATLHSIALHCTVSGFALNITKKYFK